MSRATLYVLAAGCSLIGLVLTDRSYAQVSAEVPGSVLIFPKVEADGAYDTVIQIINTGNPMIGARCFYLRGDDQTCTGAAFTITLLKQQPTHWVASQGRQQDANDATCSRTNTACNGAGFDPGAIPALPAGFRGALVCTEVADDGSPILGNHLIGVATLRSRTSSDTDSYNAIGVNGNPDSVPSGTTLSLDGVTYGGCPASWSLNHVADGSQDELAGSGSTIQTALTILPCTLQVGQPTTVNVQFSITDELETAFSASTVVTCWADATLSSISSVFASLVTRNARTVVAPLDGGIIVVSEERRQLVGPSSIVASSAENLHRQGVRNGADTIVLP